MSPRRSRSSSLCGSTAASASASPTHAAELVVEPALTQQPDGADEFAAQQHPVGGDGPLELLYALGREGGVLLRAAGENERARGGRLRGIADLGDRTSGNVLDHHQAR